MITLGILGIISPKKALKLEHRKKENEHLSLSVYPDYTVWAAECVCNLNFKFACLLTTKTIS